MKPFYDKNGITIYCGSVLKVLPHLPKVNVVVTSPPYWGLRKYAGEQELVWGGKDDCKHKWATKQALNNHGDPSKKSTLGGGKNLGANSFTSSNSICTLCGVWRGAFGLEQSLQMYIDHTIKILHEIRCRMYKTGVCFWNVGDSYAGGGNYRGMTSENTLSAMQSANRGARGVHQELSALGKDTGSAKPKDLCLIPQRVALAAQEDGWWVRSDIIWNKPNKMPESVRDRPTNAYEHILMLTKRSRYYWNQDEVREPHTRLWDETNDGSIKTGRGVAAGSAMGGMDSHPKGYPIPNPAGRNMRNVWTFSTQPYTDAHFATFPFEIPRRCILAASKTDGLVLDPFMGSGTTLLAAHQLNRRAIGIDISEEYCEMAAKRLSHTKAALKHSEKVEPLFEL